MNSSTMRPSLLGSKTQNPLDALCYHFNVDLDRVSGVDAGSASTLDVPVRKDAHMPTHILAISDPSKQSKYPILVPIHAGMWAQTFRVNIFDVPEPGTVLPIPHWDALSQTLVVRLPVVELSVPHAASFPLLALFGMGLEPSHALSVHLLPGIVVAEFPSAATMAQVMSGMRIEEYAQLNQGLWKNVLSLGPRNERMVELIQTAWNVTADARKIASCRGR